MSRASRQRTVFIGCALGVILSASAVVTAKAEPPPTTREPLLQELALQRATIVIADLERSLAFYRDVLGLPVARVLELSRASTRESLALPENARVRFATLGPDENSPGQLGLLEITETAMANAALPSPPGVATGQVLLVWRVSDAQRARDLAVAHGATLITDIKPFTNREGREVVVAAPEGTRIQLVEFPD